MLKHLPGEHDQKKHGSRDEYESPTLKGWRQLGYSDKEFKLFRRSVESLPYTRLISVSSNPSRFRWSGADDVIFHTEVTTPVGGFGIVSKVDIVVAKKREGQTQISLLAIDH